MDTTTQIFYPTSRASIDLSTLSETAFGDVRLEKRFNYIVSASVCAQNVSISQTFKEWKEKIACYRFVSNKRVSVEELLARCTMPDKKDISDKVVLCLSDTTSIGFSCQKRNKSKWQEATGVLEDNRSPGLYVHAGLCLEEETERVLGLGDMAIYNRPMAVGSKEEKSQARVKRRSLPYNCKEFSVWPLVAKQVGQQFLSAKQVIHVMDRGSDHYDTVGGLQSLEPNNDFVLRMSENRNIIVDGQNIRVREYLATLPFTDTIEVSIRGLNHVSKTTGKQVFRKARMAKLQIKYARTEWATPHGKQPLKSPVWVVMVQEDASTVPAGEDPIEWGLWTSLPVSTLQEALRVVNAYKCRWWVEQLFRILKKDGIDFERTELRNVDSIKKWLILNMKTASDALKLVSVRSGKVFVPISEMFNEQEEECLEKINQKVEGNTEKQKNPHQRKSLSWAAWIIARLGGWSGFASQRPPGPSTMSRGLEKFKTIIDFKYEAFE